MATFLFGCLFYVVCASIVDFQCVDDNEDCETTERMEFIIESIGVSLMIVYALRCITLLVLQFLIIKQHRDLLWQRMFNCKLFFISF